MIEKILKYNKLWAEVQTLYSEDYFQELRDGQAPEYLWIGCSDSRVPAETLLGLHPGQLFVHRNVANIVKTDDDNSMSVLEFAVDVLKVRHIIICGHSDCGGISAALDGGVDGYLKSWLKDVREMAKTCKDSVYVSADHKRKKQLLTQMNVRHQVKTLSTDPLIQRAWINGQELAIHGWVFHVGSGIIEDLNVSVNGEENLKL